MQKDNIDSYRAYFQDIVGYPLVLFVVNVHVYARDRENMIKGVTSDINLPSKMDFACSSRIACTTCSQMNRFLVIDSALSHAAPHLITREHLDRLWISVAVHIKANLDVIIVCLPALIRLFGFLFPISACLI